MTIKGRVIRLETMRSAQRHSDGQDPREVVFSRLSVLAERMREGGDEPRSISEHLAAGDPHGLARDFFEKRFGITWSTRAG